MVRMATTWYVVKYRFSKLTYMETGTEVLEKYPNDVLSRRRRTYIRVPKTDLGTLDFLLSGADADFGIFEKIWIFPDGKQVRVHRFRRYHWPCSCSLDSLEDFDSHWSRRMRFGRPKPKIASVTHFENPILVKYAPDWDFAQILMHFWKILDFAALVVAGTP